MKSHCVVRNPVVRAGIFHKTEEDSASDCGSGLGIDLRHITRCGRVAAT